MMYYRTTEKFGTIKFLPHLDPNLASRSEKEKKKKQENESEIRSISQGGEEKRGMVSERNGRNAVNPGSSFYDRAYSWIRGDIVY